MRKPVYLDYNATTPILPEVAEAMLPYLYEHFGNPSSTHVYGLRAKEAVEEARRQVAGLLNCKPAEVIFTSGGTESNNHAIRGVASAHRQRGNHIVTSAVEHPAVLNVCRWLEAQGFQLTILPVDEFGLVSPEHLERAITPQTILVSIMHANNEVGTIQPVRELADICHRNGILFHTDAAQSAGKIPVDVEDLGVDMLSIAGHKLYAPKGVGVLFVREGTHLDPLMYGAGHEAGRRPGTENVLEIVGLGKACQIAQRDLATISTQFQALRDGLHNGLLEALGEENIKLNGHPQERLPNTLSLGFRSVEAHTLLAAIGDQVAASAGSACHADQLEISAVLRAMRLPPEWARGTIRFSVGRGTTAEAIDCALSAIIDGIRTLWKRGDFTFSP